MRQLRIGLGVDAHALEDGVPLVLGGVRIDSPRGLAGHSDGDVIAHALIDAVLGAADLGDIGSLFPSDESTPAGVSSLVLLEDVNDDPVTAHQFLAERGQCRRIADMGGLHPGLSARDSLGVDVDADPFLESEFAPVVRP